MTPQIIQQQQLYAECPSDLARMLDMSNAKARLAAAAAINAMARASEDAKRDLFVRLCACGKHAPGGWPNILIALHRLWASDEPGMACISWCAVKKRQ